MNGMVGTILKNMSIIRDKDFNQVLRDFFTISAIAIRNSVDHSSMRDKYEERYKSLACKYSKEQLSIMAESLGMIANVYRSMVDGDEKFCDLLGEIYMSSNTSNARTGQFFTPFHVSELMALCNYDKDDILSRIENDRDYVITMAEPTCGSGGMIIASASALNGYGVNYAHNFLAYANDIDDRCVSMSYIQLSLLGIPAIITHGDALTMKVSETWYTPAYLMNYMHFRNAVEGKKESEKDKADGNAGAEEKGNGEGKGREAEQMSLF